MTSASGDTPAPPAARAARSTLLIAYIGFVSLGFPDAVIGIAWPSVRDHFHLAQSSLGLVFIGAGCGYFLSSFFAGRLIGRIGIGPLLAMSSAVVALSAFGFASAPFWFAFAACSILHGLGSGAIDAGLNNFVAHNFSARHMNWLHACYSLGAMLGPLLMTAVLASHQSWRFGYLVIGGTMAILSLLFTVTRRQWTSASAAQKSAPAVPILTALRLPAVWMQMLVFFIYTGLEVALGQWSFTLLTESRRIASDTAGLWVTIYWGSIGIGRVLFGFVVERIGVNRLIRGCLVLAVLGCVVLLFRNLDALAPIGLGMIGLALAPIFPCLMTATPQRLGPAVATHAIGFQVSAAMIGAAALPSLTGILVEHHGLEILTSAAVVLSVALLIIHELVLRLVGKANARKIADGRE